MSQSFRILLPMALLALAACSSDGGNKQLSVAGVSSYPASAVVKLEAKSGSQVAGELHVLSEGAGIRLRGQVSGLTANGVHAFHIHEKGDCSAADGTSAGGHFNPTAQPHGRSARGAHHLGDQDNLRANAKGVAAVDALFPGVSLGDGAVSDALGKAVIIHAGEDDYHSQPTGNAGGRIACGVIGRR